MFPIEIEDRLLNSIKSSQDLSNLYSNGITIDSFRNRKDIFKFIVNYYKQYTKIPDYNILKANFPDFNQYLVKNDEINYLIDELAGLDLRFKTTKILEQSVELLKTEPKAAIDLLVNKLLSLKKTNKLAKSITDKDAVLRLEKYLKKRAVVQSGKVLGLKTGFKLFDDDNVGWQEGNLIGIIGRLGVGKSWLLLYSSCISYLDGHRILFLSPEMTVDEVEDRWDVLMAALLQKISLNHTKLSSGGKIDTKQYKDFLEVVKSREDWMTIDTHDSGPFTVDSIQSLVNEFKPDLVAIDGLPLLKDVNKGSGIWENIKNISYGLKNIAMSNKIVILVTSQANRGTTDKGPEIENISYSDAIGQAADVLVMLSEKVDESDCRWIKIPKRRGGRVLNKRVCIEFDVDNGRVGGIVNKLRKIEEPLITEKGGG